MTSDYLFDENRQRDHLEKFVATCKRLDFDLTEEDKEFAKGIVRQVFEDEIKLGSDSREKWPQVLESEIFFRYFVFRYNIDPIKLDKGGSMGGIIETARKEIDRKERPDHYKLVDFREKGGV